MEFINQAILAPFNQTILVPFNQTKTKAIILTSS